MIKKTTMALLMSLTMSSLMAQRSLQFQDDSLTVYKPDVPKKGVIYQYLWWYGDGEYDISFSDTTTHKFNPKNLSAGAGGEYRSSLITTENYGNEGHPDLIVAPSYIPPSIHTTSNFRKHLDANNQYDLLRLTNFRKAVPYDTFFLIVTYGIPSTGIYAGNQTTQLELSIDFGEHNHKFEYINDLNWNKSFLVNQDISYIASNNWDLSLDPLNPGEERTILLPFKYDGDDVSGAFEYTANLQGQISSDGGVTNTGFGSPGDGEMEFAESHDPNRTYVQNKLTDCQAGGEELEYEVHFENTGQGQTRYVRIEMQLDEAHDLGSIEFTELPRWFDTIIGHPIYNSLIATTGKNAFYSIDEVKNVVTFEFHNIFLLGIGEQLNADTSRRMDFIKFKILVKDGYVIGKPINAFANIYFDKNAPIRTNTVETTCSNPIQVVWSGEEQLEEIFSTTNFNDPIWVAEEHIEEETFEITNPSDPIWVDEISNQSKSFKAGGKELEYEVHFENVGEDISEYVRIEMQLCEAHDLNTLKVTELPHLFRTIDEKTILGFQPNHAGKDAFYVIDEVNNKIIFEFHNILLTGLLDTLTNDPTNLKAHIKFKIKVKRAYVIGDPITASANVIFNDNKAVFTNQVKTTCENPVPVKNRFKRN